ncbi:MAG: TcfC E-set like domain-containing protein [Sphingobium sp.]
MATAPSASPVAFAVGVPSGFDELTREQQAVVDILFGGRRVGQAEVRYEPGRVTFVNVDAVVALLPDLLDAAPVRAALGAAALDSHAGAVCTPGRDRKTCGHIAPEVAGVLFDEDRFRLEIFVNARFLKVRSVSEQRYLPTPEAGLSVVDSIAGMVAGGSGSDTVFAIQNRAVIGSGDARLMSTTAYASETGLMADVLAVQVDKPGVRYMAGMFWAPGIDLTGRRKLIGAGIETQLDTRFDKDILSGTPLIVSLTQRSRVDLLVNGRLVNSRTYEAGNQSIDTSALSNGAYEVVLHIQEIGGANRDERRFFSKNAMVAPVGQPLWFVHAGVLANERANVCLSPSRQYYAEAGFARRLTPHLALDGTLIATNGKGLAEIGGYVLKRTMTMRLAGVISTARDYGAVFQLNATGVSRLNYNLDIRRIRSHDGRPLVPIGDGNWLASGISSLGVQAAQPVPASYTQGLADISYRLPRVQFGLSAFYRRDKGHSANYAFGPTARWSALHRQGLALTIDANAAQTSSGRNVYVGLTLQLLRPRSSLGLTSGVQSDRSSGMTGRVRAVGGVQGAWQDDTVLGGTLAVAGNVDHMADDVLAHVRADMRGPLGVFSADAVQQIGGAGVTQYSLGAQTTAAFDRHSFEIVGRDRSDSMIAVRVKDAPPDARFDILVNETRKGQVRSGQTATIAVPPYRQYEVRIRPARGELVHFDNGSRQVSVYPGTVASLSWSVRQVMAMFGRAVWPDGAPVADADIVTDDAVGHTDAQGYFQIETGPKAMLKVRAPDGRRCHLMINGVQKANGYAALGTLVCRDAQPLGLPTHIAAK